MPLWLVALGLYVAWVLIGWAIKKILFVWLRALTSKTETKIDDAIIDAANFPIMLMIGVWGIAAMLHYVIPGLPPVLLKRMTLLSKIVSLGSSVLFVNLLLHNLLDVYAEKMDVLRGSKAFSSAVIHVLVLSIGTLVVLDSIGVSITPIIASLGIGSLAVALALQPTFENIFSGLQILIDQPILPGHFVRLDTGEEGFVEKIGWRSSWVRQLPNNMVIIPNKALVNARIINFNYPSPEQALTVEVGVHYNSDLEFVERVTVDVAKHVLKNTVGAVSDFEPLVRFHTFGSSSVNFTVVLRVKAFVDAGLVRHEFCKALLKRFSAEKIVLPYPITALNTSQEKVVLTK